MLVDSHCHLDFPDFEDERDAVIERARAAGVGRLVTICTRPSRLDATLAIARAHDDVFAAAGVHPHEAAEEGDIAVEALEAIAADPKIVGIGETGLDYFYDHSPRAAQQASFRTHMRAARRSGLPLIVHTRDADEDTAAILREGAERTDDAEARPLRGVIHCFSGGPALARAAVELGFYISFSGILTFKKSDGLRAIAAEVPADRLLVETDSPYLAPVPRRGKRNEPAYVAHTAAVLAEVRGVGAADIARQTTANFFALFDKVPAPAAA